MKRRWYNSLQAQILLLLTIAILPLGSVAIYQTNEVVNQGQRNAGLALLALTERAAQSEVALIQRATGAAEFLAAVGPDLTDDVETCRNYLATFIAKQPKFSFVGFIPPSGMVTCSSTDRNVDMSLDPGFAAFMVTDNSKITINTEAPVSGQSIFAISERMEVDGEFAGFVSLSVPHAGLPAVSGELLEMGLTDLMTFNEEGTILTTRSGDLDVAQQLPVGRPLDTLNTGQSTVFRGTNMNGETRFYTVVHISGTPATVLGVWKIDANAADWSFDAARATVFPVLMWIASLAVALLSVFLLVLRPIADMKRSMDLFAHNREVLPPSTRWTQMPNELQALQANFDAMVDDILRDEANMEDTMREKNVLLKEVHHRVKNNLQLISSIMNMQIREAAHDETKTVLGRLQDRVLSLATIHRDLYESQQAGMIQVGALISETIERSVEVAVIDRAQIDLKTDIADVWLYPDQAVPLSLLVAEGMVNAVKYVSAPPGKKAWINVSLAHKGDDWILTMGNSTGGEKRASETTGMGAQLINAFAIQLGGQVETQEADDSYVLTLRFEAQDFVPANRDF